MSDHTSLRLNCPECSAELVIDAATGQVLYHKGEKQAPAGGATIESLLQNLEAGKAKAEDVFEREKAAVRDRDRLLEEKFREAMSRAEDIDEVEPPLRPFDLD